MRERNGTPHVDDGSGVPAAHAATTASPLADRVEALEAENLRLMRLGATGRAQSDAAWAARCGRLIAEHQTWYERFVSEHEEACARLAAEHEVTISALRAAEAKLTSATQDSYHLRDILRSRSYRAMAPARFIARSMRRLFGSS